MRNIVILLYICLMFFCLSLTPIFSFAETDNRSLALRKKFVASERRVALIIGNSVYQDAPLKNPVNDADSMASVLRDTGFDVVVLKNADRRKMFAAVKELGQKLKKSDVGLFYYAGHGLQVDSANYLLPVDLKGSDLQDTDDLRHNAFPLSELMDRMRDASTNNIIILDACRDNPFFSKLSRSASRGLAKVTTPASTSILYSTDPGNTASDGVSGDNGIFTNRLVESIKKDGLELVDVMREVAVNVSRDTNGVQRPVFDGVLSSKFYFRAPEAVLKQVTVEPTASSITVDRQVLELRYWESTEKVGTSSAYQSYLKKFPSGDFVELARERMEQIAEQKTHDANKTERDRLAKEKVAFELEGKEAAERARFIKEKADLEHAAKEAAERTRLDTEKAVAEKKERDRLASLKAEESRKSAEKAEKDRFVAAKTKEAERAAIDAAMAERLVKEKGRIDRVDTQVITKPQVVASLPPEKAIKKDAVKDKIGNVLVSDLTVKDESSGLIWVRNTNYCGKTMVWRDVQKCIDKLNKGKFAGYIGWRLPTIGELDQLVSYAKDKGLGNKDGHYIVDYLNNNGFVNVKPEYSPSSNITVAVGAQTGGSKVVMKRLWSGYNDTVVVGTASNEDNYNLELSLLLVRGADIAK